MSVKNGGMDGWESGSEGQSEYEKKWYAALAEAKRLFGVRGFKVGDTVVIKEKGKKVRKGEITNFVSFDLDPNKWSSGNFEARVWLTEGMTQSINGQESSNSTAQITLEMIESGVVQMVKVENKTGGDLEPDELGEFVGEVEAKIKS